MRISRADYDELIAHAREEAPNECCGYAWGRDGNVEHVARSLNEMRSPYGFRLDAKDQLRVWKLEEEEGYEVAVYHSHPRSPAEPSQQDLNELQFPTWKYLIVSLAGEPVVRAWTIADGRAAEEELVVD